MKEKRYISLSCSINNFVVVINDDSNQKKKNPRTVINFEKLHCLSLLDGAKLLCCDYFGRLDTN